MPIEAAPTAPTIRESLEAAVATVVPDEAPAPIDKIDEATIAASETVAQKNEPAPQETEEQKAERLRNKDGTFAKGKPEAAAPVAQQPKPKVPRPTSWKKDLEGHWDTLPPEIQAYVNEREKQYATGVSTYKTEADRNKSIADAVNQFAPMLNSMKIEPAHWIKSLGAAHHFLANGTPQERVQTVADIIRNNRVDAQALFQVLTGQQPQYQQPQGAATPLPQAQQQPVDIDAKVNEALSKRDVENAYKAFTAEVEAGKYPHFADDAVKGTMAQLLDSGLAQDYPSAYATALALPKHSHLAVAATAAPAPVAAPVEQKQAQAARARSQAVSVRSSTPSTMTQASGAKGLRDTLSEAFDRTTTSRV